MQTHIYMDVRELAVCLGLCFKVQTAIQRDLIALLVLATPAEHEIEHVPVCVCV